LGGIDQKYDVAVSTAAGALNNLVTRTVDGAQKCIDYLRKHKLGRATFIVLEKIQYLNQPMNSYTADKTTQKEKCVRLFDLIKPRDDEVRVAFYYALRNTIVAKNLDQATKIAYDEKKCIHRVVSLKGELIELSGTMSGGGGKARSGLMKAECTARTNPEGSASAKEAEHKLKQIETDLKNIENNYRSLCKNRDELKKKRQYLEKEIRTLTTWLKKTNTKLSKMNASVKASADLIPDLIRNITEIKSTVAMTNEEKSKIEELSLLLVEKEKEFKTASANTIGLENRVEELQKSIMNVGGNTLKRAKAVRKNFEKKLKEAEATITKTNVDIKALTKKIETSEKQSNVAEKAKEEMASLQSDNEETLKKARSERDSLLKEAREIKQQLIDEAKSEAKNEAKKIISQAQETIQNEKNAAIVDLKNQVAGLSIDIAEKVLKEKLSDDKTQMKLVKDLVKEVTLK
jgi:structural maintenance of chromosome 4